MALSGSTDFALTRDEIIDGAIRIVKGLGGKPITGAKSGQTEAAQAGQSLNMILKHWQALGIGLWLNKEINMPFAYRDGVYSLGSDHASETLVVTEVATAASETDTTLVVDSISGMSTGDAIGIELDDGTMQWTTINGAPSSATITLTAALTDDVAVDNEVMTYTTKSGRPLVITEARLVNDSGTEISLEILNRDEWMSISNKNTNGIPSQIYYDPQLTYGVLYVWPRPNDVASYLKMTARVAIQDFDSATDSADFPQEIYRAAKWNLADEIALEYTGIDVQKLIFVQNRASMFFNQILDFDAETGSLTFEADND